MSVSSATQQPIPMSLDTAAELAQEPKWEKDKKGMPVFKGKIDCMSPSKKTEAEDSAFFSEVQRRAPFNTGLDPMNRPWDPAKRTSLDYEDCLKLFKHRGLIFQHPDVVSLDLKIKGTPFNDKQVEDYLGLFPNLVSLNLINANITNQTLFSIAKKYPHLKVLTLENCSEITDRGLHDLARCCRELEVLNLNGCKKITDGGLIPVIIHNRNIRKLLLQDCVQITDQTLIAIGKTLTQLDAINLANLERIGMLGIVNLAHGCPRLQFIVLYGCQELGSYPILELAEKCKSIRTLNLGKNKNVTDIEMETIIWKCRRLEVLTLKGCPNIPKSFKKILRDKEIASIREHMTFFYFELSEPPAHLEGLPPFTQASSEMDSPSDRSDSDDEKSPKFMKLEDD